ncbi:PadR family transcriptional regulator [Mechercharimyces sp. CAU 1602]|uniref:PadR family transcriptional regulator n=1 Tax=Mechercharimyces sp. CAU 1602 TaxID=2973933 RepID=UPI0021637AC0|nr:PadR family transcriptional regulator [Mechercharimyces sp. CAU 1602]MCS1351849.1 PadR family transcriptional regulator [Mechercharimyces sp. CAU 1602]
MSLRYALMGLLAKEPATGYDLHHQFKETMIYYWHAHHSQIYRELGKMEIDQLVHSEIITQPNHPNKKRYSLTNEGLKQLLHWLLDESSPPPSIKDEFLLRAKILHLIPFEQAIQILREEHMVSQYTYEMTHAWQQEKFTEHIPSDHREIGDYFTSEYGIRYAKMRMGWCEWAINCLHHIQSQRDPNIDK